jgi:N-methylhydantoinase A
MRKPEPERRATAKDASPVAALDGHREVYFASAGGFVETPTYDRKRIPAGSKIAGPALIEEHASTTVLHPGDRLEVDAFGNLVIEIGRN